MVDQELTELGEDGTCGPVDEANCTEDPPSNDDHDDDARVMDG